MSAASPHYSEDFEDEGSAREEKEQVMWTYSQSHGCSVDIQPESWMFCGHTARVMDVLFTYSQSNGCSLYIGLAIGAEGLL